MPAAQRCFEPGVIDLLLKLPYRFEFFQAVRLIELWLRQNGIEDGPMPMQFIRFENSLSLTFPPSQIVALAAVADRPIDSAATLQAALLESRLEYVAITPAFIGILGANGGLPYHDTERIAEYEFVNRDSGPRAFLDMLSTRAVALFYQAWAKYRPPCMIDAQGKDTFLAMLQAFSGLRPSAKPVIPAAPADVGIGEEILAYYAAQFRSRCVTASVVAGVLTEYFAVPCTLEPLVGRWEDLPDQHRTRLGATNRVLGEGAMLGSCIYRRDSCARLAIGPLTSQEFERFLPRSDGARAINRVLGMFCGVGMTFDVRLVLRAQDARQARLGTDDASRRSRLGIDAFLDQDAARDRATASYVLQP